MQLQGELDDLSVLHEALREGVAAREQHELHAAADVDRLRATLEDERARVHSLEKDVAHSRALLQQVTARAEMLVQAHEKALHDSEERGRKIEVAAMEERRANADLEGKVATAQEQARLLAAQARDAVAEAQRGHERATAIAQQLEGAQAERWALLS
jgi:chromosome segregation ATPase